MNLPGSVPKTGTDLPDVRHVIVQAGGLGSRLEHYSWNKPKCLVPIDGQPLIYSLFDLLPDATFIVIVDYKAEVFERFVTHIPPNVPVLPVRSKGKGTIGGIRDAMRLLPSDDTPFLLIWSDLKLGSVPRGRIGDSLLLGLTGSFPCRWSWSGDGGLVEIPSGERGVMGLFGVPGRRALAGLPDSGEFVRWLAGTDLPMDLLQVDDAREFGTVAALHAHWESATHARFCNDIRMLGDRVEKRARTPRFQHLIDGEVAWYRKAASLGFPYIPALLSETPLTLARIRGRHPFELQASPTGQGRVLDAVIGALDQLHAMEDRPGDAEAFDSVYRVKTLNRLETVRHLAPDLARRESLRINGVLCRNILHDRHADWFRALTESLGAGRSTLIHGDPTFSNILVDEAGKPWFIDPRGSFGTLRLSGDPRYDWAKLYYSAVGEYDSFNRKRFLLRLDGDTADIEIRSGGWSHLRRRFQEHLGERMRSIELIHGLIWLSLSGFAEDDYDSILGAYVRGLSVLNEAAR